MTSLPGSQLSKADANGMTKSNFSLPPLHPSSSVGNLSSKRKSGISKKIAQKFSPNLYTTPVDSVQLHNSRSYNEISQLKLGADSSLDNSFRSSSSRSIDQSIDQLLIAPIDQSAIFDQLSSQVRKNTWGERSASACAHRLEQASTSGKSSCDYEYFSEPPSSTSRQGASLDEEKSEDNQTLRSIHSTILPRISSQEARNGTKKSYLLVKNRKSISGLQDHDELERCFPDGKVTIFAGTWNMAGQNVPSRVLTDWLIPEHMHMTADIYAVGIQEAVFNPNGFKEWESKLQKCLWSCKQVLFHSVSLGVQHLAIFVRRELIWFLSRVCHSSKSTRIVSNVKTKGAIAVGFKLFGTTLLFISSHLSYGPDPNGRIKDYHRIVQSLYWKSFGWRGVQVLDNVDFTFWMGDLNFRLEEKRNIIESLIAASCTTSQIDYAVLMERDQLRRELSLGRLFHKFREQVIRFPPTYKYDLGSSVFDTSAKNRVPAYTDRILFRTKPTNPRDPEEAIETVLYNSVPSIKNSDHKPVYGVFRVRVNAGHDRMLTPKFDTAIFQAGLAQDNEDALVGAAMKSKVCRLM